MLQRIMSKTALGFMCLIALTGCNASKGDANYFRNEVLETLQQKYALPEGKGAIEIGSLRYIPNSSGTKSYEYQLTYTNYPVTTINQSVSKEKIDNRSFTAEDYQSVDHALPRMIMETLIKESYQQNFEKIYKKERTVDGITISPGLLDTTVQLASDQLTQNQRSNFLAHYFNDEFNSLNPNEALAIYTEHFAQNSGAYPLTYDISYTTDKEIKESDLPKLYAFAEKQARQDGLPSGIYNFDFSRGLSFRLCKSGQNLFISTDSIRFLCLPTEEATINVPRTSDEVLQTLLNYGIPATSASIEGNQLMISAEYVTAFREYSESLTQTLQAEAKASRKKITDDLDENNKASIEEKYTDLFSPLADRLHAAGFEKTILTIILEDPDPPGQVSSRAQLALTYQDQAVEVTSFETEIEQMGDE